MLQSVQVQVVKTKRRQHNVDLGLPSIPIRVQKRRKAPFCKTLTLLDFLPLERDFLL